jgi:hypothetical protein
VAGAFLFIGIYGVMWVLNNRLLSSRMQKEMYDEGQRVFGDPEPPTFLDE